MNPSRVLPGLEAASVLPPRPLHLAIGMFDGVHLGHLAVVESAVQSARGSGGVAAALTFDPHPSRVLRPDQPVRLLQSPAMRAQRLLACGVDAVITERFTRELAQIGAEELLPHLQARLPHLKSIYVGENWRFGRGRRGDVALLVAEAGRLGVAVVSAPRINHNGEPISSTRIRASLEAGEIARVNAMLGYNYLSEGCVEGGKKLGRSLGFPTLNLPWMPECQPRFGVYVVRVGGGSAATSHPAVANYGLRPTVENVNIPRLEVHVLDDCPFGRGDSLTVEWLEFLRPELRFDGVETLRAQIRRDVGAAQAFHRRAGTE